MVPESTADLCRECGSPRMAWNSHWKSKSGSANSRCHWCYSSYKRIIRSGLAVRRLSPSGLRTECPDCLVIHRRTTNGHSRCPDCVALRQATQKLRDDERATTLAAETVRAGLDLCRECGDPRMAWNAHWNSRCSKADERCRQCYNAYGRDVQTPVKKLFYRDMIGPPTPNRMPIVCPDCQVTHRRTTNSRRCPACVDAGNVKRKNKSHAKRVKAYRDGDASIHWMPLGERDGWKCHLCGLKVPQKPGTAHEPHGATVDHLVPVSADGIHAWSNVALAHRKCNLSRGAGGVAQLRLVG